MDRRRLVVTNKLSGHRSRTPYDRPNKRSRPDSRQRDTERDHAVEAQSPGLISRIKDLLSPRKWVSPKHHTAHLEESLIQDAEMSTPQSSSALLYTHRMDRSPKKTPNSSLLDDSESPNHRLIEFFRAKGDAPLTDVEREGVLSLIQKASDTNQSVLDLTPKRKEALVNRIKESETSLATPVKREPEQVPWDLPFRSSPSTPVRLSPVQSPKYSPLYSSARKSEDKSSLFNQNASFKRNSLKSSPSQHFSIPTPYKRKSGNSIIDTASKFHFSLPTKSSLAHSVENAPKSAPRPLSQTASILSSLLDQNKSADNKKDDIGSSNIYASPVVREDAEKPKHEEKHPDQTTATEIPHEITTHATEKITKTTRAETASSSMKKTPKFTSSTPRITHAYQPVKSSGLRQAVTASPVKSDATTKVTTSKKEPFKFDFSASTDSAMKKAPASISPSKPLFGYSPVSGMKSHNTENSFESIDKISNEASRFEFPVLPVEPEPTLTAIDEKKLREFRNLYTF